MGDSNFRRMLQCTIESVVFLSGICRSVCGRTDRRTASIRRIKSAKKDASIWNVEFCNKIIVVLIGTNDVLKWNRLRRFWHQFKHLMKIIAKLGAHRIYYCSILPCRGSTLVAEFNAVIRRWVADRYEVIIVNEFVTNG